MASRIQRPTGCWRHSSYTISLPSPAPLFAMFPMWKHASVTRLSSLPKGHRLRPPRRRARVPRGSVHGALQGHFDPLSLVQGVFLALLCNSNLLSSCTRSLAELCLSKALWQASVSGSPGSPHSCTSSPRNGEAMPLPMIHLFCPADLIDMLPSSSRPKSNEHLVATALPPISWLDCFLLDSTPRRKYCSSSLDEQWMPGRV